MYIYIYTNYFFIYFSHESYLSLIRCQKVDNITAVYLNVTRGNSLYREFMKNNSSVRLTHLEMIHYYGNMHILAIVETKLIFVTRKSTNDDETGRSILICPW